MKVYTESRYPPIVRHDHVTYTVKVRHGSGIWRWHDATHSRSGAVKLLSEAKREFGEKNAMLEVKTK